MKKIVKLLLLPLIAVFVLSNVELVKADDDHHEKHYEKKYKDDDHDEKDYKDDDYDEKDYKDDEYEGDSYNNSSEMTDFQQQVTTWNVWTREIGSTNQGALPIKSPANVKIKIDGTNSEIFAVPTGGQLYVPAQQVGELLGATVKEYPNSGIMEIQKGQTQLIVRIGSNAAYENMVKTPMPVVVIQYNNKLYIPISVIANAFQHKVEWDDASQTLLLQNQ